MFYGMTTASPSRDVCSAPLSSRPCTWYICNYSHILLNVSMLCTGWLTCELHPRTYQLSRMCYVQVTVHEVIIITTAAQSNVPRRQGECKMMKKLEICFW